MSADKSIVDLASKGWPKARWVMERGFLSAEIPSGILGDTAQAHLYPSPGDDPSVMGHICLYERSAMDVRAEDIESAAESLRHAFTHALLEIAGFKGMEGPIIYLEASKEFNWMSAWETDEFARMALSTTDAKAAFYYTPDGQKSGIYVDGLPRRGSRELVEGLARNAISRVKKGAAPQPNHFFKEQV